MILQILTDAREIDDSFDAKLCQVGCIAHAR
jgi:hypothetical protein